MRQPLLSLSLGRQKRPVLSISDATKRRVCNSPLSKERLSIKSIDRSDRCTVGRHARPPCARPQSLLYRRRKRTRRMHTREAAEQAATAEKHWENAKVKPISILSILAGMRFASGLSPSSRNGFFPFFSIEFRPIERIGSNRVGRRGRREWTGWDGTIGDPERHRVAQRCYGGCFDRSTLVARTTTIKVVSVDRDVTLPVACRSTFIAVIQPRIERPTAERRNGNTQWFSCEPVGTFAIDRSPPRGGHG